MTYFYIAAILLANLVTAAIEPFALGPFIIPAGSLIVGFTFVLRDYVQMLHGRTGAYKAIATATALSIFLSLGVGDLFVVTAASALAFLASETADTEVFTRYRGKLSSRILVSGLLGGAIDSGLFVIIGLSPLTSGILPWEAIPAAIIGQMATKWAMQGAAAAVLKWRGE